MALADRAELAVRLTLDDKAFSGPLRRAQGSLGKFGQSAGRVGRGVGQIGAGLARAGLLVGGAAVTGIAAVAKAAIDFEDAFAGVRKTVNEADLTAVGMSFESLALDFRKMATEIPIAATEFARLGEMAGALGVKAQDIDDFVKTTALLGVTTDLSADMAAQALGKIGTILGLTGSQYQDFADVLVNLGNQGASTESEIIEVAKRFAGTGRQAGLTTEQILALSSAITSLGAEPEAAGSALSRIFSNVATEIANGTKKGKEFAAITGDSMDELRKRIDQGDALGIVMDSLEAISGMSRTEAASTLKALGITNVRDRDAILKMSQNLGFVNDQLKIAADSTDALGVEAAKRFSTIASKLTLVKQNAIEAAITMGSEFLPAIGRVADRAIALLKDPATRAELTQLGKNIGAAIDGIDWAKVKEGAQSLAGAMKGALDFALMLVQALDKLPGELKAAGLGFLALNKLSGGLVGAGLGNVFGGLAEVLTRSLGSQLPGAAGKLFTQPVFVTNFPPGFGGVGPGGAPGGAGGLLSKFVGFGSILLILDGLSKLPDAFSNFTTSIEAAADGNVTGYKSALDQFVAQAGGWLPFGNLIKAFSDAIPDEIKVTADGPDKRAGVDWDDFGNPKRKLRRYQRVVEDRKAGVDWSQFKAPINKLERKLARIDAKNTRVITGVERTRSAVNWSKIAVKAAVDRIAPAGHSDADRIVNAIHGIDVNPYVGFTVNPGYGPEPTIRRTNPAPRRAGGRPRRHS